MTSTRPPLLAADHIRHLTRTHITTSVVLRDNGTKELHHVTEPPLLTQLGGITQASSKSDDDAARGAFTSKPAAHLEAVDALHRIDTQARSLARQYGTRDTGPLLDVVAGLAGAIGDQPDRRVRAWWATARLLTQHDSPAHRPHGVPCPSCWKTNTLRIRIDEELATCTGCGDVWDRTGEPDHGSLDVLGQHVRWCAEHEVTRPEHRVADPAGGTAVCTECDSFRASWSDWKHASWSDWVASGDTIEV